MSDEIVLDWTGEGYAAFTAVDLEEREPADGWALLRAAVARARLGSFELVSRVARDIVARADHPLLHMAACEVVADAGNAADLEICIAALDVVPFRKRLEIASMLVSRGRLLDVPIVFRVLEAHRDHADADVLRLGLNALLCEPNQSFDEPTRDGWGEFRRAVGDRYFELWSQFGTHCVHVYQGRRLALTDVIAALQAGIGEGFIDVYDRRVFEAVTGFACNHWFDGDRPNLLRAAADLEEFIEAGNFVQFPPGQRAFMGHCLEDVAAVGPVLATYPSNRGLDVPAIRSVFDEDPFFALPSALDPFEGGFFVKTNQPPPSAELTVDRDWPWLSFHTCLRAARAGHRQPLQDLARLINSVDNPLFRSAVVELVAAAGGVAELEVWRSQIRTEEVPQLTFSFCWGLVRRGMLRDIPLVLQAYERHADDPKFPYLEEPLNALLAFRPVRHGPHVPMGFSACRDAVTQRLQALTPILGREDVPLFRGAPFSVVAVAREIIDLVHGPDLTADLRMRFEGSTGVDCSAWEVPGSLDRDRAKDTASRFLASPAANAYEPGVLYFFGRRLA
jgi:hypothetical protein